MKSSGDVMKKFHIITTTEGCATNLLENATYRDNLRAGGMENSLTVEEADVIIVNTCGYTTERENYSANLIEQLRSLYPRKEIIVGGCLPKINGERLRSVYEGPVFAPGDLSGLNQILNLSSVPAKESANFFDDQDFEYVSPLHKVALGSRPLYFRLENLLGFKFQPLHNILKTTVINKEYFSILVSQGCTGKCTFCAIKSAKGEVKSRSIDFIIAEFRRGLKEGHKKFWLVGDDIGCYGYDIGTDFSELLGKILEIKESFELVINYFEPMWFIKLFDKMGPLLKDPRILNINFPIQSGSFRIVRRMGREYSPDLVAKKIYDLKKANSDLVVKTNIIVGFPGETLKDFWLSIKSVFDFDAILAIKYTSRPGTGAMKYKDHIPEHIKEIRMRIINGAIFVRHCQVALGSILRGKPLEKILP
jgi:tRNA A37 methylthiotransferase MiaB